MTKFITKDMRNFARRPVSFLCAAVACIVLGASTKAGADGQDSNLKRGTAFNSVNTYKRVPRDKCVDLVKTLIKEDPAHVYVNGRSVLYIADGLNPDVADDESISQYCGEFRNGATVVAANR